MLRKRAEEKQRRIAITLVLAIGAVSSAIARGDGPGRSLCSCTRTLASGVEVTSERPPCGYGQECECLEYYDSQGQLQGVAAICTSTTPLLAGPATSQSRTHTK